MHRVLSIFFVVVCTALAWWALELQGRLVFKEREIVTLRKELNSALTAEKVARAEVAPFQENAARLLKERDEARGASSETIGATTDPASAAGAGDSATGFFAGLLLKQMDSPEMKNMIRSEQAAESRKTYGKLIRSWNLSTTETDTVLKLLTDRELGDLSDVMAIASGKADKATIEAIGESLEKGKTKADERLKAILGPERMKELAAFDEAQEHEQVVSRYSEHLDINGSPLNVQQRSQLADLVSKESADSSEVPDELMAIATGNVTDEQIAKNRKTAEERQARITQKAAAFLSPDQVNGLQSAFREENEEQDASLKLIREMTKNVPAGDGAFRIAPGVKVEIRTQSSVIPSKP